MRLTLIADLGRQAPEGVSASSLMNDRVRGYVASRTCYARYEPLVQG